MVPVFVNDRPERMRKAVGVLFAIAEKLINSDNLFLSQIDSYVDLNINLP